MAELSHRALRELIESFGGCDEYFTEMISAGALVSGGQFEAYYIDAFPCPDRVVYQLVGANVDQIADAAALLDRKDCAGIDLNMGCSAPAIVRTGAGVRWMADPDKAAALIRRVRPRTRRRLSVKLRLGMEADLDYLVAFCRRLEDEGVDLITLHPRTAREKFKRRARWDFVDALRRSLRIPVAGNGDIEDAAGLLQRANAGAHSRRGGDGRGCDAVMVGRLAVRAPWIFAQARAMEAARSSAVARASEAALAGSLPETVNLPGTAGLSGTLDLPGTVSLPEPINIEETALRFLELLVQYQPPEFHLSRARRFFSYFCDNVVWGNYLKTLLNRETELAGIRKAWSAYFSEHPEERQVRKLARASAY
jgi:tRNA-dihydrouridine synthase